MGPKFLDCFEVSPEPRACTGGAGCNVFPGPLTLHPKPSGGHAQPDCQAGCH